MLALLVVLAGRIAPAGAETRVAALTRMLASSSDKTRLAAVLALAKLGEPGVEKPLVTALRDPSVRVRAVAATALGRLDCNEALPTLRVLAKEDADGDVRKAASNAAIKIATAVRLPQPDNRADRTDADAFARRAAPTTRPFASEPHPDLFLLVNSSSDDSPGSADKATRRMHADIIKRVLIEQCKATVSVTAIASDAQRWGLDARHVDLSVTKLAAGRTGDLIEVNAQLRLTISDDKGKMLSFLSGGAKVQVSADKFDVAYLPGLRKEALEDAMRGMFDKLLAHLRDHPTATTAPP